MKKITLFFCFSLILSAFWACNSSKSDKKADSVAVKIDSTATFSISDASSFRCVPGEHAGFITAKTTLQDLIKLLGKDVSATDTLWGVEGDFTMGTILFKGTANEAHIYWKDTLNFKNPDTVWFGQSEKANENDTKWHCDNGIKIGFTLKEIEVLNGKPFKFSGFGWDYGGQISDTQGGKLQTKDGLSLVTMTLGYNFDDEKENKMAEKLMGDSVFSSNDPNAQKLNPKVIQFGVSFK